MLLVALAACGAAGLLVGSVALGRTNSKVCDPVLCAQWGINGFASRLWIKNDAAPGGATITGEVFSDAVGTTFTGVAGTTACQESSTRVTCDASIAPGATFLGDLLAQGGNPSVGTTGTVTAVVGGGVHSLNVSLDATSIASTGPTPTPPPRNCDKERAAVAAAQAKVAELEKLVAYYERLVGELSAQEDRVRTQEPYLRVFLATLGVDPGIAGDLDRDARRSLEEAQRALSGFNAQLAVAKEKLAQANDALTTCLSGRSAAVAASAVGQLRSCGAQQATLAADRARAGVLAAGAAGFPIGPVRLEGSDLRLAVTSLQKSLSTPVGRKHEAKLSSILTGLRRAEAETAQVVGQYEQLTRTATAATAAVGKAKNALAACEGKPRPVSISETDTWTYNTTIGKGNICIDVRTSPAQATISATLTGTGYRAHLNRTPLQPGGKARITSEFTRPGAYTKTLIVYDTSGAQTATVTKAFTVAPPPQNGPTASPPCPEPTK